ncbi:hypothetical protein J437_LFUL014009 [Ladona fulva]|uniref:Uncharacterized protein n=1 Tax=Ladona fulva TaxID=123851 RepID=A0A8K0KLQ5_LADFU|nr:hypothetical protein J437_LFUL014009 [Ladona fulva]
MKYGPKNIVMVFKQCDIYQSALKTIHPVIKGNVFSCHAENITAELGFSRLLKAVNQNMKGKSVRIFKTPSMNFDTTVHPFVKTSSEATNVKAIKRRLGYSCNEATILPVGPKLKIVIIESSICHVVCSSHESAVQPKSRLHHPTNTQNLPSNENPLLWPEGGPLFPASPINSRLPVFHNFPSLLKPAIIFSSVSMHHRSPLRRSQRLSFSSLLYPSLTNPLKKYRIDSKERVLMKILSFLPLGGTTWNSPLASSILPVMRVRARTGSLQLSTPTPSEW